MATLKHISFFQLFLPSALLLLLLSVLAAPALALGPASPFCDQAAPGPEQEECNALVNNAKTWEEAMRNVINAGLSAAEPIKPMVNNIEGTLPQSLKPISKDSIAKTCHESLDGLLDGFHKALGELTNDPYQSISSDLAAASSSLSDCTDGLQEFGANSPGIQKGQVDMLKYANIALAVANHLH